MNVKPIKVVGTFALIALLSACTNTKFYHQNIMRGQVVKVDPHEVVICVGSNDGAEIGKILNAYKFEYEFVAEEGEESFRKVPVGKVKISSIIDEHFARAKVIAGAVGENAVVEWVKK